METPNYSFRKIYEGTKPYIFVSYSHRDSSKVLPVINRLQEDGYRVWYDDGINPGTEWPETIAQHLNGCAVFFAFISNTYVESFNCKRELDFAVHKRKPFLAIFLEETKMPLGMEMQISTVQSMKMYKTADDLFYERLYNSGLIKDCLDEKKEDTECETFVEEIKNEVKKDIEKDNNIHPESEANEVINNIKENKLEVKSKDIKKEKTRKKNRSAKVVLCIALIFFILIIAGIVLFAVRKKANPYRNESTVSFEDQIITDNTIKKLSKSKQLKSLTINNCQMDISDKSLWGDIGENLSSLNIINSGLEDEDLYYIGLNSNSLYSVNISDNPKVSNIDFLENSNITHLDISHTGVTDLSVLSGKNLGSFTAIGNGISDIKALSDCKSLDSLDLSENKLSEIKGDYYFDKLRDLNLSNNQLKDLSFLSKAIHLQNIYVDNNQLTSLKGLENCILLKKVSLSGNMLNDVSELEASGVTIQSIYLSDNQIEKIDFNLPQVHTVYIDNNKLSNLDFLSFSTVLEKVSANNNNIEDIKGIQHCGKLGNVFLSDNLISGDLDFSKQSLYACFLNDNDITSVTLNKVNYLVLNGNPIENINVTSNKPTEVLLTFNTKYTEIYDEEFTTSLYLEECPYNKRVALEDIWGSRIHFVEKDEMETIMDDIPIY